MRKVLICALALGGFAASAQAADLSSTGSLKDPLPDTLSYAGVTFYGSIDVGGAYQEHGYGFSPNWINGLNYQPQTKDIALGSKTTYTNNALSTSTVGLKVEEGLGYGFAFIGKAETGFNPIDLNVASGAKSLQHQTAVPNTQAYSDSARDGQLLNGEAYAGFSNPSYGTLVFGRENSFLRDDVAAYDPMKGSVALSLVGNTGTIVQGAGDTEASVWDNAAKYTYQFGPVHAGVQYSAGGNDTELQGYGVGANVGGTYKGVSVDAYYTKENGAVNLDSATAINYTNTFKYTISNNEAWGVSGKYVYELGGGFKDAPASKLTFFGGFVSVDSTNPDHAQSYYSGYNTIGGNNLTTASWATAYNSDRVIQTGWAGASYETGPWTFSVAYYHENQNSFYGTKTGATTKTLTNGGDLDWESLLADYKINKHFDVYAGVSFDQFSGAWVKNAGGTPMAFTDDVNVVTGVRLKF